MYNGSGGSSGDLISTHETNNRFENDALTMSGNGEMRTSLPSSGYIGASGTWNVMLNANNKTFQISDINTTGYSSIALSFGFKQGAGSASSADFAVEVSSDGTTWSPLTLTFIGNTNWYLNTPSGVIPATTNLRIRFTNKHSTSWDFRIDDVKLTGNINCNAPTIQATSLLCSSPGFQNINLQWTNGNGSGRIVKINTINSFTNPIDGNDPVASSIYSGSGEQVVYNGSGNTVNISGLEPCREYWFRVYEYNCTGTSILFNSSTATGNPINISTSSIPPSNTILASENFEGASTWSYTQTCVSYGSGGANGSCVVGIQPSPFGYLNSKALVKSHSVNNGSSEKGSETTLDFNLVNIPASSTNISFSFRLASLNAAGALTVVNGAGHDNEDFFQLQLQLNSSGGYSTAFTQKGSGDQLFGYLPEKSASPLWNQNVTYSAPTNDYTFFTIAIPDGTTQVDIRYVLRNNRTGENWCIDEMILSADIPAVSTLPSLFSITGNNSFCSGSTGTLIGLNGSQLGVSYQLFLNGVAVGSPVAGTGTPIDFGYHSSAGTYTVVATNTSFQYCKSDMLSPLVVTFLPSPTVTGVSTTPAACGTDNGTITIAASGGTTPYSYSIDNGATWQVGNLFTGLAAGTYMVKVKGANTCESAGSSAIITLSGSTLTSTVVQTNVKCYGDNTGSATVTGTGGSGTLNYVWNTSPVQNGQTASNLSAGTYVCTITDALNCSIDVTVVITQPSSALNGGVVNQTNVGCYGGNTGSVEVSGSGGTPPYSYSWNTIPVQTGPIANNLIAGTYTCTILDFNNCPQLVNVTILEPAAFLDATTSFSDVTCNGGNNGFASVTASGGTPLYTYEWNTTPPQFTSTAINLTAGSYSCKITDANGCEIIKTVTVGQPATALIGNLVSTPALICDGASNGTATVNASGGTPGYSYSWNTTPVQTTATAINLAVGSYICTITDLSLCTYDVLVNILSYPPPTPSNAGGNQNVCGLSTTLSANTPTFGTGLWSQVSGPTIVFFGNLSSPTSTVSTTLSGTYVLQWTITNEPTCPSSYSQVTIVFSDPPSIANAGGDMDVCGLNSSMSATVPTVGTGQWSQVSGPAIVFFGNLSSPTSSVSTTLIGTYILRWTVTNMPQCPASTDDVSVTFGNSVTVVASSNGPVCVGDTIRLYSSISGATYSWTGPGTYTSNVQNPIIPDAQISDMGDYFVTVTNIPGNCPTTNDYVAVIVSNIPSTSPINNNASGVDEVCSNSNTPYTIDPPTPGSTYEWVLTGGGDIIPTASSNLINVQWNSTFGTFVLKVVETSAGGCQGDTVRMLVTVNSLSTPAITISASQNPVCTGSDVTFTSSIQEGGASPQYKWYVNGIGPVGSNSTYSYFPTDGDIVTCKLTSSSPCALSNPATSNTVTMTVAGTVAATIDIVAPTQSVCIGELAEVQAVLGNGGANPDITWYRNGVEIVGEKSAVLSFFPANGDKIKARLISSSSCASPAQANSEELMFIVSNMLPLGVQVSQDPAACYGQPLVIKALATNMGLTPVYEWFCNGISLPGLSGSSISRTFAENDSVSVKVTSSLSCATGSPATSPKLKVIMPAQLLVTKVDTVWASCGAADGSIVVEASGGTGAYKYSILPAESWRSSNKFDSIAPNTQYRVKVKDQNDCVSEYGIVTISSKPGPLVSVSGPGYACEGSPLAVDAISPHTGLNYEWLGPSGATMTGNQLIIPQVQLSDSGVYIARGSNVNGCFDTAMYKLRVMPVPIIDFGLESTVCQGVAYDLDAGSGFTSYKWQDGSTNQSYSAQVKGTYFVEVTDADGCKGSDTLFIIPCGEVSFPNAFSPNKDSKNDYFLPVTGGINPKGFRLIIFNSWGQKLFETTDPTTGWDGSALGGEAPVGIYTYVATFSMPDPDNTSVYLKPVTRRGLVVLLR